MSIVEYSGSTVMGLGFTFSFIAMAIGFGAVLLADLKGWTGGNRVAAMTIFGAGLLIAAMITGG